LASRPGQTYTPPLCKHTHRHPRGACTPAPVQAPVSQACTCLTKNYAPDGTVVFADSCTNETATADAPEQARYLGPVRRATRAPPVILGPDSGSTLAGPSHGRSAGVGGQPR
jgi:hypothetical protein